jgi:hypothetical protein
MDGPENQLVKGHAGKGDDLSGCTRICSLDKCPEKDGDGQDKQSPDPGHPVVLKKIQQDHVFSAFPGL